jgi:hypothetical protein
VTPTHDSPAAASGHRRESVVAGGVDAELDVGGTTVGGQGLASVEQGGEPSGGSPGLALALAQVRLDDLVERTVAVAERMP